jgi:hypothetical protein
MIAGGRLVLLCSACFLADVFGEQQLQAPNSLTSWIAGVSCHPGLDVSACQSFTCYVGREGYDCTCWGGILFCGAATHVGRRPSSQQHTARHKL